MKKVLIFLLAAAMLFSMFGCNQANNPAQTPETDPVTQAPTEAETEPPTQAPTDPPIIEIDATIAGVDISGLSAEDALEAIKAGLEEYSLKFTFSGKEYVRSAADLSITLDEEALLAYLTALEQGQEPVRAQLATCNSASLTEQVRKDFKEDAKDATVYYEASRQSYSYIVGKYGKDVNTAPLTDLIAQAVGGLTTGASASVSTYSVAPEHPSSSPAVQSAIEKGNEFLKLQISYTYETTGLPKVTVPIDKGTLASFVTFAPKTYALTINQSGVESYVSKMHDTYHEPAREGYFKSTLGSTVYQTVKYYGSQIDTDAMKQSLLDNLNARRSGTFAAPFHSPANREMAFGGNYVEVNLSAQTVWVYKNGQCVLSSPFVSGKVYGNYCTPTGVYAVQDKDTNCYLVGADYMSFVYYWVGFYYGYGLHDATWRWNFGGDIYLYNGSHGCVNMPLNNAAILYNNVSVGTAVIVYGGLTSVDPIKQEITGTAAYSISDASAPFKLDATAKYQGGTLKYESSDDAIVSVDDNGVITPHAAGTATITVSTEAFEHYSAGSFKITVTVFASCGEGNHTLGDWTEVTAPTCKPGEERTQCSVCHQIITRELPATQAHTPGQWTQVTAPECGTPGQETTNCTTCGDLMLQPIAALEHDYTSGGQFCDHGCGTENPNYEAPSETPTAPPVEESTEAPTAPPVEDSTEAPTPTAPPVEDSTEAPTPTAPPVEDSTEAPTETSTEATGENPEA